MPKIHFLNKGHFFSDHFTVTIKGQTQTNSDPKTETQKLRPIINKKLTKKTENHNSEPVQL